MSETQFVVIFYLFLWSASRIRGCFRRWRQPLLRGPEWFFSVRVQPDFYSGPGRKILHHYRIRMLMTVAVEIPIATAIFITGHLMYLAGLVVGMGVLVHINHAFNVDRAERQARKFAVPEAEQPVALVNLSLKTRRLSDYSNRQVERVIVFSTILVVAWLIRYYMAAPEHHDLRLVFGFPAFLLYAQAGLLLIKYMVVAWRSPVPQVQAEEHMEAREEARKLYLKCCDVCRVLYAGILVLWPIMLKSSPANRDRFSKMYLIALLVIGVALAIWQEIKRRQVLAVALRARPVKLPDLMAQSGAVRWPLCYQPSAPMLVLKGARGYSVNLANTLAQLTVAYLVGFGLLMVVLRT